MNKLIAMMLVLLTVGRVAVADVVQFKFGDGYGPDGVATQVVPEIDSIKSEGDNNRIVRLESPNWHFGGPAYGYLFVGSTVFVRASGTGVSRPIDGQPVVTVNQVEVRYNSKTTEIMSVTWSDKRTAYLLTFKEAGKVRTEWLDFNSDVFRDMLGRELNVKGFKAVENNTTGLQFIDTERRY